MNHSVIFFDNLHLLLLVAWQKALIADIISGSGANGPLHCLKGADADPVGPEC